MDSEHPATDFPVTHCPSCDTEVLCHLDLDERDTEILRCVECSAAIDAASVRWLDLHDLEELGYGYVLPPGGCGRPGCGNGRCGRASPDGDAEPQA